jgi:hypothetical protein
MYVSIGRRKHARPLASSNLFKTSFKGAARRLVCYKVLSFGVLSYTFYSWGLTLLVFWYLDPFLQYSVHKIWILFHFLRLTFTTDISVLIAQVAVLYKIAIKRVSKSCVVRACFWCHVRVRNGTFYGVIRFHSYRTLDCLYRRSPGSDASLGFINSVLICGATSLLPVKILRN